MDGCFRGHAHYQKPKIPKFMHCLPMVQDYLKAVSGFKIKDAFPDMKSNPYHWRVDPYEPNRVWFTVRTTATHTGPLKFGSSTYKATGAIAHRSGFVECQ